MESKHRLEHSRKFDWREIRSVPNGKPTRDPESSGLFYDKHNSISSRDNSFSSPKESFLLHLRDDLLKKGEKAPRKDRSSESERRCI